MYEVVYEGGSMIGVQSEFFDELSDAKEFIREVEKTPGMYVITTRGF